MGFTSRREEAPVFDSAQKKFDRARQHRSRLEAAINQGLAAQGARVRLRWEYDEEIARHVFRVAEIPDFFAAQLGLTIGDVVHNLRCALDHVVWELAVLGSQGKPLRPERVKFPICKVPERFTRTDALAEVEPRHRALIEQLQPYNDQWFSRNLTPHPLMDLQDMSNRDKHRVLNTVAMRPHSFTINQQAFEGARVLSYDFSHASEVLQVDDEFVRVEVEPPNVTPDLRHLTEVIPRFALEDGRDIMQAIMDMEQFVFQTLAYAHALLNPKKRLVPIDHVRD